MSITKIVSEVIEDGSITIQKINDAAIVTEAEGISNNDNDTTIPTSAAVIDYVQTETILDDSGVVANTYGDAANIPQITVDSKGRITSATEVNVSIPAGTTVGTAGNEVSGAVTLQGGGDTTVTQSGQTITISSTSSGGGGGGELSIERDVFTATADQTVFNITSAITSGSNTQVYIDGVYQAKSNYTTSGSTITFSTGVPLGAEVEVVHFISILSKVYTDTFTGDASTVNFTASKDVTDENVTQVYIDGVYQSKDNYTTSGTTITFSTAPPSGSAIEVVHFTAAEYSTLNSNQFTGTGSQTDFTLTQGVTADSSFVFIQGVYQEKDTYSISGTTLSFTSAPLSGYSIEVITVGSVSVFNDTLYLDNFNGTGSQVNYTLSTSPASENAIDVYINGLYQQKNTFSLSGSTLTFLAAPPNGSTIEVKSTGGLNNVVSSSSGASVTLDATPKTADFTAAANKIHLVDTTSTAITVTLPTSPSEGDEVGIIDYSSNAETNNITVTSTDDIQNSADDKFIDYDNGAVNLIYTGATKGWLVKSAANETATALSTGEPPLTVDYLVVAGGGGGGGTGGGGGAGGLRTSYGSTTGGGGSSETELTLSEATNYTVTVGAPGAGAVYPQDGAIGSDSVFSTITSTGGGGGSHGGPGTSGGSGGAGGYGGTGGAAVSNPVQGFAGGGGMTPSNYPGGGGGGAGAIGGNSANTSTGGNGGNGLSVSISGLAVTYAGGGGGGVRGGTGGTGGTGGGGNGNGSGVGVAGTTNTGGGGGSGSSISTGAATGANGGSGVVILRYPSLLTISNPGSGLTFTTATVSTDKVTTFTAGTGNIQFN